MTRGSHVSGSAEDARGGRPKHAPDARRRLVVADVSPLDVTGVSTVTVGIVLWTIALVALLPFYGTLREHGHLWWLWTCVAAIGLGLLGRVYCRRREGRLRLSE